EFGNLQYRKFAYLVEQMKDRVRLYINVPGSLIINTSSKQPKKPPLSSTKVAAESTEMKPDDTGQQDKETSKDSPAKTPEKEQIELQEMEADVEETDDVNQPLLPKQQDTDLPPVVDTVVMVHSDGIKEATTSGMNEETL
ncbi:hypothetical protein QZH41_016169, partial [Actinostola sp. cb2023]